MAKVTREIKCQPFTRTTVFERVKSETRVDQKIDEKNRVITLSFSSEEPVEREFGDGHYGLEILDHTGDSVDFSRITQAGPLLVNHDRNDVVGVIEKVWVEANRGFATVRFGKSARATEIFNDVLDGIRKTVSFGYRIMKLEKGEVRNGLESFIVKRWQPYEISLEVLPADITVGYGRKDELEPNTVTVEEIEKDIPEIQVKERKMDNFDVNKERENGIKAERKRLNGIRAVADKVRHILPDVDALAEEFMNSERSLDEFNAAVVAKMDSANVSTLNSRASEADLGLTEKENKQFSITRLATALSTGNWKDAGFELEVSRAQADANGTEARGAYIPLSVLALRSDAALTTSADAIGGGLIPTDFYGSQYIDVLRANSVVVAAGARVLPGLVGDVDIPKASNEATFSWLTEGQANDSTQYSATTVSLSPADIGGALGFTRKMMKQTGNPAIEQLMRDSLNNGIGVFLDKQVLVGTGTGASGLTTHAGTKQASGTTGAYSAITHAHVVGLETGVATNNAETGKLMYITSPTVRGILKTKVKDSSGAGGFIMNDNNMINGYPCMVTSHAGSQNLFYGNWNDVLIPMWGGVDIVVDTATNVANGGVVLRAFLATDIAFRHTESFSVQTGITL